MVQKYLLEGDCHEHNLNFLFGMYGPATDSIIANIDENTILVIRCKECNSSVIFDDPNDVVYLYRLAIGNTSALCQIRIERKRIAELCGCYELVQLLVPICLY